VEFGLSEEQVLLEDSVRRFLTDKVPLDRVRQFADDASDHGDDIWRGLTDLGVTGLLIPEDKGGVGLKMLDAVVVAEALGRHVVPAPFLGSSVIAPRALTLAGRGDDVLAAVATGEQRVGIAFGEAISARADAGLQYDGGKLSGKSLFVLDYTADKYLVATPARQILLVDGRDSGLSSRVLPTVDRTRPTGELVYDRVAAELISDDPDLFDEVLDAARVTLAADSLGAAQEMLDQSVAYAGQREQFNRVIASFQAVKHMCAEMVARLEPCRSMVWFAGYALDDAKDESRLTACHTKAHVQEMGKFVSRTATEVHGGIGFTDLVGLHYWFKRIGFNRQVLGSPEMLREEAAALQGLAA